jgi:hypothetical protein
MNIEALFIISFGGAFGIFWLINYIPISYRVTKKKIISPKLIVCKLLAPFDAAMTMFLIAGGWIGLSTSVLGINMMMFNVLTGLGLSLGVIFIKKFMVPQWQRQFDKVKDSISPTKVGPTKW